MVVLWSNSAKAELRKAFEYIALDSVQNAELVKNGVIDATIQLAEKPEKYPPDKYKINNDGSWRAFEKYNYRISYKLPLRKFTSFAFGTQVNLL